MIAVQGLTKRYGRTTAVDRLSFEVRPGQVTGLVRPGLRGMDGGAGLPGLDVPVEQFWP